MLALRQKIFELFKKMNINIMIAGVSVGLSLMYESYMPLYRRWETDRPPEVSVRITREELLEAREVYPPDSTPQYLEHMQLCYRLSGAMMPLRRAIFHGAAIGYRGRAYIITAPSGVGKTTLYLLLKLLMGDELILINGDKPMLEFAGDRIVVHPTPWNGKESMGRRESLPLGGLVFLGRGEPHAERAEARAVAEEAYRQFLFLADDAETARNAAALCDELLRSVPCYRFWSRGDDATAVCFRDAILKEGSR